MDDLIDQIVDNWEDKGREKANDEFWKEVDSHPAFATDLDSNPSEISAEIQALQALKFDSDTPDVSVVNYKNEGNYYYRKKTYTLAIVNYTKALQLNVNDNEMNCILYTNRAACHFHQENYRKCIKDCLSAIKMNPIFVKPYWRAAHAAAKIDKCDEVLEYCEKGLEICSDNKDLLMLKETFLEKKAKKEESNKYQLKPRQLMLIEDELKKRGVVIEEFMNSVEIPMQHFTQPFIDSDKVIHFNVLVLYPEHCQTDFLQDVMETASILDCMRSIFSPREKSVDWDIDGNYTLYTPDFQICLQIYYENQYQEMVKVSINTQIKDLIKMKQYRIRPDMVIEVNVVSMLSEKFLANWKRVTCPNDLD